jgi:hypothetical protein
MRAALTQTSPSSPHSGRVRRATAAVAGALAIAGIAAVPAGATTAKTTPKKTTVTATVTGAAHEKLSVKVPPKDVVIKRNAKHQIVGVHTTLKLRGMKGGSARLVIALVEKNGSWSGSILITDTSTHLTVKGGLHGKPKIIDTGTVSWTGNGAVAGKGAVKLSWTL